jgi:hypothetical protein
MGTLPPGPITIDPEKREARVHGDPSMAAAGSTQADEFEDPAPVFPDMSARARSVDPA